MQRITRLALMALLTGVVLLNFSCGPYENKADAPDVVARVAKGYYDMLVSGNYDGFIDGTLLPDTIPATYRQMLLENAKMFMASQNEEHKGIRSVEVASCTVDTARNLANAFLMLNYGDGGKEKIVVQMKKRGHLWYMR